MEIENKHILLAVSGGIAAYKAVSLCRLLVKAGASVRVAMTANATEFVTPLTFETVSGHQVGLDMFTPPRTDEITHVAWSDWADLLVVAPATANIIGKAAAGIADDLVSCLLVSVKCPVVFAPAMHHQMWANRVVQRNAKNLQDLGYHIMMPGVGDLASGDTGPGRMPEPEEIMDFLRNLTP
jgi:phosphopantothenoylcysteine decarboxylase/phosphopantothenate--cysteine ligase